MHQMKPVEKTKWLVDRMGSKKERQAWIREALLNRILEEVKVKVR